MGTEFPWRWGRGTIPANLDVIWGMSVYWFGTHLPTPSRFQRRLGQASIGIGVCWFKAGAGQHIARMREMCGVLDEIGYPITCCWTAEPGWQIYQDDFQIVALDHKRPANECWM